MATQSGLLKDKSNEFGQTVNRDDKGEEQKGMSNLLNNAQEKVSELSPNVSEAARKLAGKAKDVASNAYENVGSIIQEHPTQAFFIGLGVGCLVGATISAMVRK